MMNLGRAASAAGLAVALVAALPPAHLSAGLPAADQGGDSRELQAVLSRVVGYAAGYRQQYSGVVAEEDYTQRTPTEQVRLRSDVLLVRTETDEGWVSFRDVYEVNGAPVRDRDDRLKRLFLDPSVDAALQLRRIKEESARYNVGGDVARNVNVPLFPLLFLEPGNVPRFQFRLGGPPDAQGRLALQYDERQRPTIVNGMPATGTFLVEDSSGAVVRTSTIWEDARGQSAELVVQYTRDSAMRLWVPSAMHETYRGSTGNMVLTGAATYSNFRRFQVRTDETVTIKKHRP